MATRSIYQSNGKPLSQQALYQQKLKQGVYNAPGSPIVGVNSNASDTAALLAASADLTVRPSYERTVAIEAHDAAQAARNGTTSTFSSVSSASAAAAALGKQGGTGIPEYSGSSVYQRASSNSTKSVSTRTDPERDYRSGLTTKSSATTLNIGKISSVANQNSSKSLNSRFNPELDFRSGLQSTKQPPTEFLDQDEEDLAAKGAIASLKHGGSLSSDASSQIRSKSFTASEVVNKNLLAAATQAAEKRLSNLNSTQPVDFKQQAQLYAGALALAQKRSDERIANHKVGVIDLGGGLTIAQSELDKMATLIVQPILNDIKSKAEIQREQDEIVAAKHKERTAEHESYKRAEFNRKIQEKLDLEQAKKERLESNEGKKRVEENKFSEHQVERNGEVTTKEEELKALEATHAESKAKLIEEKQAELDRIDAEETELINGRKDELKTLQDEKDEILKPTLDELEVETKKLKELTDAKDELTNEVSASQTTNDDYKKQLEELEAKLKQADEDFELYTTKLAEATEKHEETSKSVDALHEKSAQQLEEAEKTHKDLDSKIEELEATKQEHLATKANHKKDIVDHIEEQVKNEHKINEELPEHLRKEVDEKKIRDTLSIFTQEEEEEVEPVKEPVEEPVAATAAVVAPVVPSTPKTVKVKSKKSSFREKAKKFFTAKPDLPKDVTTTTFKKDTKAVNEKKPKESTPTDSKEDVETIGDLSINKAASHSGGLFKEEI